MPFLVISTVALFISPLKVSATEFEKEIANIYTTIDDLKNSWTGESATRYTQEIEKYKSDFVSLAKTLKQHGALAKAAGTDYNELENSI